MSQQSENFSSENHLTGTSRNKIIWYVLGAFILLVTLGVLLAALGVGSFLVNRDSSSTNEDKAITTPAGITDQNSDKNSDTSNSRSELAMNIDQILEGNYDSIEGTWLNMSGDRLTIKDDRIEWSTSAGNIEINKLVLSTPASREKFEASVSTSKKSGRIYWDATGKDNFAIGYSLSFYPAGEKIEENANLAIEAMDKGNRIVALPGNAPGRFWDMDSDISPYVFFHTSESDLLKAAKESQPVAGAKTVNHNPDCVPPSPHAHECAGGSAPSNAERVPVVFSDSGLSIGGLATPSKNIFCDFTHFEGQESQLECVVQTWYEPGLFSPQPVMPRDPNLPGLPSVQFKDGQIPQYDGYRSEAPMSLNAHNGVAGLNPPLILDYGKQAVFDDWVCASAKTGLSCWNTTTGHGATIAREFFETF